MLAISVIQQIEEAWTGVPYPGTENIFTLDSYDDEDIVNYFGGTTWRGHRVSDLRTHSSAFTFFTPIAWHYWLPAFILTAIEDPSEADVCVECVAESCYDSASAKRVPLLTVFQRQALCSYFAFQIERFGHCSAAAERKALALLTEAS